eukprot:scaffold10545_cov131-Isochrysis_galbana.AAC.2
MQRPSKQEPTGALVHTQRRIEVSLIAPAASRVREYEAAGGCLDQPPRPQSSAPPVCGSACTVSASARGGCEHCLLKRSTRTGPCDQTTVQTLLPIRGTSPPPRHAATPTLSEQQASDRQREADSRLGCRGRRLLRLERGHNLFVPSHALRPCFTSHLLLYPVPPALHRRRELSERLLQCPLLVRVPVTRRCCSPMRRPRSSSSSRLLFGQIPAATSRSLLAGCGRRLLGWSRRGWRYPTCPGRHDGSLRCRLLLQLLPELPCLAHHLLRGTRVRWRSEVVDELGDLAPAVRHAAQNLVGALGQ